MSRVKGKADNQSITQLYGELEKAVAATKAIPEGSQFDQAVARCNRIAKTIVNAPARSIDEMLLKIRVVGWSAAAISFDSLDNADNWQPDQFTEGDEYDALVSLREDLRKLKQAA